MKLNRNVKPIPTKLRSSIGWAGGGLAFDIVIIGLALVAGIVLFFGNMIFGRCP